MRHGPEIAREVARRISGDEPCWFPGLATELVASFWADHRGIDPANYSTAEWLGEGSPPQAVGVPGFNSMRVEPLPCAFAGSFKAPLFATNAPQAAVAIRGAITRLGLVGSAVDELVRSVHVVASPGTGYDLSHSEPNIPFSVFVSVPNGEQHGELRLAESMLHEAMHLQLTLIERHILIAEATTELVYSPWKGCPRPVGGVLHGLYVFSAIQDWLIDLAARQLEPADSVYADRRLGEIGQETEQVSELRDAEGLTNFGRMFAAWLTENAKLRLLR